MITQETEKVRKQMQIVCIDDLVPKDHLLRLIDKAIDWTFIYDLVRDTYSDGMGRPSIDPVTLIKIPLIQYLYGIKSMRQTIKEIEVNMAYRWFLGLELYDPVPHFSTFGKNYTRRFKDTDLFEQIFQRILEECYRFKLVDPTEIFVDATHVKARANNRKMQKRIAKQEALFYADMLCQDINADREAHGKNPLKDKDDNNKPGSGGNDTFEDYTDDVPTDEKTIKCSTTDPESGWFRKGEHKHVFAYGIETACDKNGWIIDFTVNPGNEHDSRTFKGLYDKLADAPVFLYYDKKPDKEDELIQMIDEIIQIYDGENNRLRANAYFIKAEIYRLYQQYEKAALEYKRCLSVTFDNNIKLQTNLMMYYLIKIKNINLNFELMSDNEINTLSQNNAYSHIVRHKIRNIELNDPNAAQVREQIDSRIMPIRDRFKFCVNV